MNFFNFFKRKHTKCNEYNKNSNTTEESFDDFNEESLDNFIEERSSSEQVQLILDNKYPAFDIPSELPDIFPDNIAYSKEDIAITVKTYLTLMNKESYSQRESTLFNKATNLISLFLTNNNSNKQSINDNIGQFFKEFGPILTTYVEQLDKAEINKIFNRIECSANWNSGTPAPEQVASFVDFYVLCELRVKKRDLFWSIIKDRAPKNSAETLRRLQPIECEVDNKVEKILKGHNKSLGYCHSFWSEKKRILKEDYGIDWYTPAEENPDIMYD